MMGCCAWMDESERRQGPGIPTYMIGVCLCDQSEADIRRTLNSLKPRDAKKLHWRDMTTREKQKSVKTIDALGLTHIVVAYTPSTCKSERSRRKCMEVMLPVLEKFGVSKLIIEARESHQDMSDRGFIQTMRSRKFITDLRAEFIPGACDARLWIPDQVLGAVGDQQQSGGCEYNEFTQSVEVRVIGPG